MIHSMALFDSKQESSNLELQNIAKIKFSSNEDVVLCDHCKRTASNGIRCLGMCVADNDY